MSSLCPFLTLPLLGPKCCKFGIPSIARRWFLLQHGRGGDKASLCMRLCQHPTSVFFSPHPVWRLPSYFTPLYCCPAFPLVLPPCCMRLASPGTCPAQAQTLKPLPTALSVLSSPLFFFLCSIIFNSYLSSSLLLLLVVFPCGSLLDANAEPGQ